MQDAPELTPADLLRRLENTLRPGTIAAVNHAANRVRVNSGNLQTGWLPWLESRAGNVRTWCPPSVGEQCLVLSPGGDLAAGWVILGSASEAHPAPSASASLHRTQYPDGTVVDYDHAAHALTINLQGSQIFADRAKIELTIGATVLTLQASGSTLATPELTVDAPTSTFTGAVTVQGPLAYLAGLAGSGGAGAELTGELKVIGTIQNNGVNVGSSHTHSGVQPGGSNTGAPS